MIKSITRRILPALLAAVLLATALPALASPLSGNAGLPAQLAALVGQAEATRLLSTSEGTAQAISLLRASGAIIPQQGFSTIQRPAPELTGLEKAIADLKKGGAKVYIFKAGERTNLDKDDYFVFQDTLYRVTGRYIFYQGGEFVEHQTGKSHSSPQPDWSTQIYP